MSTNPQLTKSPPVTDRAMPQAVDVERAVIGAVFIDNEAIDAVRELLLPEAFYHTPHRHIFSAMLTLRDKHRPIDLLTVTEAIQQRGLTDFPVYLVAELVQEMATAANVRHHAEIVFDCYRRRALINRLNQLSSQCYDQTQEPNDLVAAAARVSDGLEGVQVNKPSRLGEVVTDVVTDVRYASEHRGQVYGVCCGIQAIDDLTLGLQPTDLCFLAARPSMGKTALSLCFSRHAARAVPVLYFSREMSKKQLGRRLLTLESRIDSYSLRKGTLMDRDWATIDSASESLWECPIFIDDKTRDMTTLEVVARRAKRDDEIGLIVVDYLQLLDPPKGRRYQSKEQEVSATSKALKDLAKDLETPVIALSQLSRAVESRQDKRPQLSDLRDSGSLEQDADIVMFLYRPEAYGVSEDTDTDGNVINSDGYAEINLAKNRDGQCGRVDAFFNKRIGEFLDWNDLSEGGYANASD